MDHDKFRIDFPDEHTIQAEIQTIVNKGLKPKESFYSYLQTMVRHIGFKHLFRDMTEIIFTVVVTVSILLFFIVNAESHFTIDHANVYSSIFIFSPLLYLTICILFFVRKTQEDTYEVEMTCKYNMYQLGALRMLVFSIISMAANAALIGVMVIKYEHIQFMLGMMISVTSLFVFSTAFLYALLRIRSRLTTYGVISGWVVVNMALFIWSTPFYYFLLSKIPLYVYLVLTIGCFVLYIRNLKKLLVFQGIEGEMEYVSRQ